jgi:ABC-2 type transport system ATP-binding protein
LVPAIVARGLRKEYGAKVAVDALDLDIEAGEVFGFLGPNGAGKSTSVKMLLGLVLPTAGHAELLGVPISQPRARRSVGFLPEHFRFHEWLRADEFLALHARLAHVPHDVACEKIPALLERVGLTDAATRPLGTYSKGMLQRIGLAQALVNDPSIVFLDEPTSGLDPLGRRMVRDIVRELSHAGTTVFLNSHLLSEVEVTCSRVAFVAQGRVRHVTSIEHLNADLTMVTLRVGRVDEGLVAGLRRWSPEIVVDGETNTLTLHVSETGALPEIARWVVGTGAELFSLTPRALSLEDLFVRVVGGDVSCEN